MGELGVAPDTPEDDVDAAVATEDPEPLRSCPVGADTAEDPDGLRSCCAEDVDPADPTEDPEMFRFNEPDAGAGRVAIEGGGGALGTDCLPCGGGGGGGGGKLPDAEERR